MLKFSNRTSYDLLHSALSVRFLKLISTVVSAKNAALFPLFFPYASFGVFSKLACVLMLSWLLLAGPVSSGVTFAVSTSFSEGLYMLSFLNL